MMTDKERLDEVLDVLEGMVEQHCWHHEEKDYYDSGFIGINANAIELLCQYGRMTPYKGEKGCGRCWQAHMIPWRERENPSE